MSKEAALAIATGSPAPVKVDAQASLSISNDQGAAVNPAPDELVSSRIAQIAKKEAKYQAEVETYKKQLADFHEQKGKFDPFYKKYQEFEELKSKDPVQAIKLLGFSDTDFINYVAAQEDKSTPEEKAAKIAQAEIKKFTDAKAKEDAEATEKRNQEAIVQFQKSIADTVKADADKYEYCNYFGEEATRLIYETVDAGYKEDIKTNPNAEPMSAEEAAMLVEKYYEERDIAMASLKKRKPAEAKVDPVIESPKVPTKEEPLKAEVKPGMPPKTLTNKTAPTIASTIKKPETKSEKRERLMNALRAGVKP